MSLAFSLNYIEGTLAGSALSLDANPPDTTTHIPLTTRVTPLWLRGPRSEPPAKLTFFALNGTTITVQPYFFDDTIGAWFKLGAAVTATPAAPGSLVIPNMVNAKMFMQITANTGVTAYGYVWG